MKKILIMFLCVILIISAVACGQAEKTPTPTQEQLPIVSVNKDNKLSAYSVEPTDTENELTAEYVENVDNKYYFYYFYLGLIKQVPSYSSIALQYTYDTDVTITFNALTEDSLSNTVSKSEEVIDTYSSTKGLQANIAAEFAVVKAKLKTSYQRTKNWGKTISESNETTSAYVNSYSKGYEEKVSFSEDAGFVKGNYYRMSFYENVKAYGVLIYDVEDNKYVTASQTFLKSNSTVRLWEQSPDGIFEYEKADKLDFDVESAIKYAQNNPPSSVDVDNEQENPDTSKSQKISVTMNRYNCNDGNNYNKNEQEESAVWRSRHNGFEIGQLNIYGCTQINNSYTVNEADKFAIRYQVLQNTEDLPRVGTQLTHVENDSATQVTGTNINSRIGYGAYWVRITYTDDSQIQYNKADVLKNATNGTIVDIVTQDNIDSSKTISKIEVVLVYELYAGGPGVLGIWWHEYTNWRCEYTYNFIR